MKIQRILIVIVLAVFLAYGWASYVGDKSSTLREYNRNIKQANQWYEDGLYQRAIQKYELAIEYDNSEENWDSMFAAYDARFKEDSEIYNDYVDALTKAIKLFSDNEDYVEQLVDLYMEKEKYQLAYDLIIMSEKSDLTNSYLMRKKLISGYRYRLTGFGFQSFLPYSGDFYSVVRKDLYSSVNLDGSMGKLEDLVYLSQCNDEGAYVRTDESSSRLIDGEGVVLGIFDFQVMECGLFSEDLLPVLSDDSYAYYDSFAVKQFGNFEQAGAFQDGKAAVKQDGMWGIINSSGEFVSDERYSDILLDRNGYYLYDGIIVAAKDNLYSFYNSEWKVISDFVCNSIDVYSGTDLFAFEQDGKWGFVTSKGEVVIEPLYDGAKSFSNGVAAVQLDGKWGFVTEDNQVVVDFLFDDADYFNKEGACMVLMTIPNDGEEDKLVWKTIIWTVERE